MEALVASVLAELVDGSPSGLIVADAEGTILLANREIERMFGHPRSELVGQPIEVLIPRHQRTAHVELRRAYLESPAPRIMGAGRELSGRHRDGSEFPIEVGLNVIASERGTLVTAAVIDLTTRRQDEVNFSRVVDASPYGMLMVDSAGTIVLANEVMSRIVGYSRAEMLGQPMEMLLPERYRTGHAGLRSAFTRAPALRPMGSNRDLTARHKDGTEIPVEIGLNPVQWRGQTLVLGAVVDISVRKKLEIELRQANLHMEEFTYVASHDLKSPLRGISDLVDWLREDLAELDNPSVHHNLDRVQLRVSRMESIISDLLDYARAGRIAPARGTVAPRDIIDAILELEAVPPTLQVTITCTAEPFRAARVPLETVLRNLIANAVKHHDRENGQIAITVREEDAHVHIAVSDDGPGIAAKARDRVFRLFQTVSAAERKGSGIGLAICKRLVEGHGGRIVVEANDPGRGVTFHVWWPRFPRKEHDE
jgi:PAS domain S-box-containing protein